MIAWYGSRFVLNSSNLTDVILNSLAVGFITDIDEGLWEFFVSEDVREMLEGCVPVIHVVLPRRHVLATSVFFYFILVEGAAYGLNYQACSDLD